MHFALNLITLFAYNEAMLMLSLMLLSFTVCIACNKKRVAQHAMATA